MLSLKINFENRVFGLDLIRAFAILMVVYIHGQNFLSPIIDVKIYENFYVDGVTIFFVLSGFLPRVFKLIKINDINEKGEHIILTPFTWFYEHICKHIATDLRIGSLMYAIILIFFYWAICYLLDKKKIYIKV